MVERIRGGDTVTVVPHEGTVRRTFRVCPCAGVWEHQETFLWEVGKVERNQKERATYRVGVTGNICGVRMQMSLGR